MSKLNDLILTRKYDIVHTDDRASAHRGYTDLLRVALFASLAAVIDIMILSAGPLVDGISEGCCRTARSINLSPVMLLDDLRVESGLRQCSGDFAKELQKKINKITDSEINISKPVFRQPKGGLIRSDRVSDDIKRICDLAKIERFSAHAFRATFISRCVASGMPVKDLMEICGHKDVEMTLGLYAHAEERSKTEKLLAVNFD